MIRPTGTKVAVADAETMRLFHNTGVFGCTWSRSRRLRLRPPQMILFPLTITWMWFQIFKTSSIPSSISRRRGHQHAEVSWRTVAFKRG